MKCIFLAAGYATRLYPLTENFPKPLLKVGDRTILDWLIDDLFATGLIDEYIVVTNHKFAGIFREWAASSFQGLSLESIRILDDGTSTNDTRLGAVKDLELAIKTYGIDDDSLVMAGDNLLTFSLKEFVEYARKKDTSCIMRYAEADPKRLRKSGIVEVDADDRVLSMEEKPADPKSHWCCPPFYCYKRQDLARVGEAIAAGCGVDAPGSLAAWLSARTPVHAWPMPGPRFDIGSLEAYEEAKRRFGGQ